MCEVEGVVYDGSLRTQVERLAQLERQRAETRMQHLTDEQQSLGHRVSVLSALLGRSEQGWGLSEVEYLLRIANQRLQLQRDTNAAAKALEAADERLREYADPHYLKVREQIARDIAKLSAFEAPDSAGISAWRTNSAMC